MKRLNITVITILFVIFPIITNLAAQDKERGLKEVRDKDRDRQEKIIMKDRAHQRKILAKFYKFYNIIKKWSPRFKMKIPVHPGYADEIKKNDHPSKVKQKKYFAYISEPYRLRALPFDKNRKYIKKVNRGLRVEVLFTQQMKPGRKNITRDWCMVKLRSGAEGYIPLNLLARKKPARRGADTGETEAEIKLTLISMYEEAEYSEMPEYGYENIVYGFADSMSDSETGYRPIRIRSENSSKKMVVQVRGYLNIREQPNAYAYKIGRVYNGEIVEVLRYSSNKETYDGINAPWAEIHYRGNVGWVFSGYLKKPVIEEYDRPDGLKKGEIRYVKADLLRVRDEPGEDGCVIMSIPHSKKVRITDVTDELQKIGKIESKWVEIKFEDYTGWVFGAFLSRNKNAYVKDDDIKQQYVWPVQGYRRISSPYGWRGSPIGRKRREFHRGIDIPAPRGTPIKATASGDIIVAKYNRRGYGNYTIIEHKDGNRSLYGHQNKIKSRRGDYVKAGQVIGYVGTTGRSTGNHLHFEIRVGGKAINPLNYIHACLFSPGQMNIAFTLYGRTREDEFVDAWACA